MAKYNETIKSIVRAIISHNGESDKYSIHDLLADVNFSICNDFTVDYDGREYRIIENDCIESIMKDELSSDTYLLGCFNAWFLSDIMDIPMDAIEKIQNADCYDALGIIISNNDEMMDGLVSSYISADGAGHHFSLYDGSENDCGEYTVFCIN